MSFDMMSCDVIRMTNFSCTCYDKFNYNRLAGYSCPPPPTKPLDLFPGPTLLFITCSSHGGELGIECTKSPYMEISLLLELMSELV